MTHTHTVQAKYWLTLMMAGLTPPGGSRGTVQKISLPLLLEVVVLVHSDPPTVTLISLASTESRCSPCSVHAHSTRVGVRVHTHAHTYTHSMRVVSASVLDYGTYHNAYDGGNIPQCL